jgi:peptide/nickel transport system ATP-binding protein
VENDLVQVTDLKKWFPLRAGPFSLLRSSRYAKAVDGVSFSLRKGEILTLAGESGSGKTTIAKLLVGLVRPTSGRVYFENCEVLFDKKKELKKMRRKVQMIFQDPYDSLSDRMKIYDILAEPLRIHKLTESREDERKMVEESLQSVGLPAQEFSGRYPYELSGGQRQRVAVARALILQPRLIVADEPVSMLDISVRAGVLNLILDLRDKYGLTYLFITHDFSVARYVSDRIAVIYRGQILEEAPSGSIISDPLHPYTRALISAVPVPNPRRTRPRLSISKEISHVSDVAGGCLFYGRCAYAKELCRTKPPKLVGYTRDHRVACHLCCDSS